MGPQGREHIEHLLSEHGIRVAQSGSRAEGDQIGLPFLDGGKRQRFVTMTVLNGNRPTSALNVMWEGRVMDGSNTNLNLPRLRVIGMAQTEMPVQPSNGELDVYLEDLNEPVPEQRQ